MEMFPAANEDQWTLIREVIDLSDYYVVVVGGRYGSVTADGVSFTEMEYDYAVDKGIPVLGFVHAVPGSIPVDMSEIEPEAREKLEAFRAKVKERMMKEYRTPDELASVVSRGLIRAMKQHARPGWVRGDQAMTDAVRAEIAELRASLAEAEKLGSEIAIRAGRNEIDLSFEHGTDEVELIFTVRHGAYERKPQSVPIDYTWDEIVDLLGPSMLDEAPEPRLREILAQHAWGHLLDMPDGGWGAVVNKRIAVVDDSWGRVLVQLRALGIIRTGQKKRTVSDRAVYWTLTPAGDDYLVRLKATRRGEARQHPVEPAENE